MDELKPQGNGAVPLDTWEDTRHAPYKPRKPWGRIAVLMIIIGAVLLAAGWLSGARGGRVYFENGLRIAPHPFEDDENAPFDVTFSDTNIHSISVNATSRGIRLEPSLDARVRVTSGNRNISLSETGGHLSIDARGLGNRVNVLNIGIMGVSWGRGSGNRSLDFNFSPRDIWQGVNSAITVYVPSSVQNIDARSLSGSVRLQDISTSRLSLQSTSGSVNVDGGAHGNVNLRSTSGSVRARGIFTGDIDARTTSGGVNVQDENIAHPGANSIRLQSTSGSVNFETQAPIANFNYELSVSSGTMRVNGNRLDGRRATGGSGNTEINARTTSGSVGLHFGN